MKGMGPIGGPAGKAARQKGGDSGSEFEPSPEELDGWKSELKEHCDKGSEDMRTAFSARECNHRALRRLGAASFLGGRRLEEGGLPLYDDQNKANLHLLLGAYSAVKAARRRRTMGDTTEFVSDMDRGYLRWLVRQARELRLVNSIELRRFRLSAKRVEMMRKSGSFSLTLEENLAEASDVETQDQRRQQQAENEVLANAEARFPERKASSSQETTTVLQSRLRSLNTNRMAGISISSSHNLDMQRVREQLLAPKLSFDWEDKGEDEEHDLEVEVPEQDSQSSTRDIFRDQLRRSVSFHQAKTLGRGDRTNSSASLKRAMSSMEVDADATPTASASAARPGEAKASGAEDRAAPQAATAESAKAEAGPAADAQGPSSDATPAAAASLPAEPAAADDAPPVAAEASVGAADAEAPTAAEQAPTAAEGPAEPVVAEISLPADSPGVAAGQADVEATAAAAAPAPATPTAAAPAAAVAAEVVEAPAVAAALVAAAHAEAEAAPAATAVTADSGIVASLPAAQEEAEQPEALPAAPPSPALLLSPAPLPSPVAVPASALPSSTRQGPDYVPTQDWISPTAMWGASPTPSGGPSALGVGSEALGVFTKRPDSFEISPTLPFVPIEAAAPKAPGEPLEISPTEPFVPLEAFPGAGHQSSFQISPTMPFVPQEALAEEARSKDGAPEAAEAGAGGRGGDVAADNKTTSSSDKARTKKSEKPVMQDDPEADAKTLTRVLRRTKRVASPEPENLGHDGLSEEESPLKPTADGEEAVTEADLKRRKTEREWLRHKRALVLKEEGLSRKREELMAKVQKRRAEADRLGVTTMSKEEQSRYEAMVGIGGAPILAREAKRSRGLAALVGVEDDDAGLLGGFSKGPQSRPRILAGAGPRRQRAQA